MGDSDDEYDRRRGRDKFRRERNDYNDRSNANRREDWPERNETSGNWNNFQRERGQGRRDYRDNYNSIGRMNHNRNDRYGHNDRSGDMSPPSKRIRGRDWDDRYPNYELGGGYHPGVHGNLHSRDNYSHNRDKDDGSYQPPMMTLKQFLNEQDDHINEETLISKYNEYKTDFRKTQIQEFFNRHKDEEWFRCKYFPDEIEKRKEKQAQTYKRRLEVFMELFDLKFFENVSLDVDNADQIVRVLDAAVIKLEGGTDFDLGALDENPDDQKNKDSIFAVDSSSTSKATVTPLKSAEEPKSTENKEDSIVDAETGELKESDKEENDIDKAQEGEIQEPAEPTSEKVVLNEESGDGELMEEGEEPSKPSLDVSSEQNESIEGENKPRPLHKTCSIFFRNIAPSITRQEIEDECKKFPGFLRFAISEPQMDRRFNRRGWATYVRTVNIREICWALNSLKIRGTEIGPIVNRDLTRRIRSVNAISSHKSVVRADIRHAAKLIMKLDAQKNLWQDENNSEGDSTVENGSLAAPSRNPLLKNITDYLIEEASAEEEELLGKSVDEPVPVDDENGETNGNATVADGTSMKRDEELIKVLDRLLFYLRIVHSLDYYSHSEYPNEDEMPNRIGLIHARGLFSSSQVSSSEVTEYLKEMEEKITPLLEAVPVVTPEEARKLGLKDIEEAVEAFIKENTKELGEGKWLCPLSNKKFMGPEFVRKHILNKHMERVEQVRAETHYFNNYIQDPKRPQLPEHPLNRPPNSSASRHDPGQGLLGPAPAYAAPAYAAPAYGQRGPMGPIGYTYGPGGRYNLSPYPHEQYSRNSMKRSRYRDLDAPIEE